VSASTDYINQLKSLDPLPTTQVLELLGFKQNHLGNYSQRWERLEVIAPEWLGGYHFLCNWYSADGRRAAMPEFRVGSKVPPASLLALLYELCGESFQGNELPLPFQIGKEQLAFQRMIRSLTPRSPTIWADRKFLRFCLSYLDKRADWSNEDYTLRLAVADNQLRIEGKLETVFCPVRGEWLGVSTVFAKILFRRLPKRFSNSVVVLQQEGKGLRIDRHLIPASWEEKS
jgi:hypothetical protein